MARIGAVDPSPGQPDRLHPLGAVILGTLGNEDSFTKYTVGVSAIQQFLVSASGQMSVPAAVRHRWNLDQGGPVDVVDLGFAVLTVPAGEAQKLLGDLLSREDHAAFVSSLADDPELATT